MEIDDEILTEFYDNRYAIQGMLIYRKSALIVVREMQKILEENLEKAGHEPVLFPVLIPEDILKKESEHIKGFETEVFWVTEAGKNKLDKKLALRPTSETPVYTMFSLWIRSHKDLPMKVHQSCAVYRYETKQTRPLIRGREFLWNEGHSAFKNPEDAENNVAEIRKIYSDLLNMLCIPYRIHRRPEWDKFPGASYTLAYDTIIDGKILQIATIHNLSKKFSEAFDINYEDEEGKHKFVHLTCYGPSFGRLLASLLNIHKDDAGLKFPTNFAPTQIVVVPILTKGDKEEVLNYCRKIKEKLDKFRIVLDESDKTPGDKFYYWEKRGAMLRIEAGPRDIKNNVVVVVRRDTKKKEIIKSDELNSEKILEIFKDIDKNLIETAVKKFNARLFNANSVDEVKNLAGKGIITIGLCEKEECRNEIENYVSVLGVEEKGKKCIMCGKEGRITYVGKTY
ncbi:MAG: proline--tRNA ligase [Candidatus Altiarchaeales archaeon A3]|nr:MAG: proline--tRNA ligase [Candidatus Altiarchaeales archaeon A3]